MANPIALAVALSRTVAIKYPHCGFKKLVDRKPKKNRVCPRCRKHFPEVVATRRKQ